MFAMDNIQAYAQPITADQYRARANLIRRTADAMTSAGTRRQLLEIAEGYDRLADNMDWRGSGRTECLRS